MPLLCVERLRKVFTRGMWLFGKREPHVAVEDLSFTIKEGEILGLLGANGAGKTTTTQMLLGTLTPTSGAIAYFGKKFDAHRSDILQHVSFASAYARLPGKLTVWENLDICGRLYGISRADRLLRATRFLKFFDMWESRDVEFGVLSAGQMTRVILAKAFLSEPWVVLLDEPTASLDPDIAYEVRQFILQQKKERGIGILCTSHNMDEVAQLCDRALMLVAGRIVANGTPRELAASVAQFRLNLVITGGREEFLKYVAAEDLSVTWNDVHAEVRVEEQRIPLILGALARAGVSYSHISIDKPTLEEYFLRTARRRHEGHGVL
jgi:ABC-2 type transport system ATP-binding protein